jgi:hypothetical protein
LFNILRLKLRTPFRKELTPGAERSIKKGNYLMYKRILATVIGLLAFAAVPAMASASPVLTENGVPVSTGAKILATNSGNITLTSSIGTVTCTKSQMTGTVKTNSGSTIQGQIETASFTGSASENRCSSTFPFNPTFKVTPENLPWCIHTGGGDAFTVSGGACGGTAKNLRFTLSSVLGNCTYERAAVAGTYVTNETPVTLKVGSGQTFTRVSGSICPETGTLAGGWTLETDVSPFTGLSIS